METRLTFAVPRRRNSNLERLLSLLISAALLAATIACGVSDEAVESEIEEVDPSEVVTVSAKQMMDGYESNELRANQLYEGRVVSVSGVVDSVGEDLMGDPYVLLTDGSEFTFTGVQCFFGDSHRDELARLSKGDRVTLRGQGEGYLMNALVRGCRLAE